MPSMARPPSTLNFDAGTNGATGFIVTPSVGQTVVIGLGMESANDSPDRDPLDVTIEGSNDDPSTVTNWNSGNWTLITEIPSVPIFSNRYEFQYIYFPNEQPYREYRWTVLKTAGPSTCCMQIAEVQLLALTAKADCSKAAFVEPPTDTPVLPGSQAQIFATVNGPWPLQWYTNGVEVPGATKSAFTTDVITSSNANILYTCAIVGCQTSAPAHTVLFTPSSVKSIGIQFAGGGANGAPSFMNTNDIAGVQLQSYWNVAAGGGGASGDGISITNALGDPTGWLTDSDGNTNSITFSYTTTGTWGAGVDLTQPTGRMLNGIVGDAGATTPTDQVMIFSNVPPGTHALLIYSLSPPLQVQTVKYAITNQGLVVYEQPLNKNTYLPAPGFYRASSTNASAPDPGDFVRFDGLHPDANGQIVLTFDVLVNASQKTGVNAIQLLLNAPNPGQPPLITSQPQPSFAPSNGVMTISVAAVGNGLSYQWRLNGQNLHDTGAYSGANTATLTISPFTAAQEGIYSVAIFNPAGSTISGNAAALLSNYNIKDQLVLYYPFDETTGTNAASSASGGLPATELQGNLTWAAGEVQNAAVFDGQTTLFVSNYSKTIANLAGSVWVNIPTASAPQADEVFFRNSQGDLNPPPTSGGANLEGQFDLGITRDAITGNVYPSVAIGLGNNKSVASGTTNFPADGAWHHVAFSADGAQLRLFLDGQQIAESPYSGVINQPSVPWVSIGSRVTVQTDTNAIPPLYILDSTTPDLFTGSIDELALWTRALSASEIQGIYQAGRTNQPLTAVSEAPPTTVSPATLQATLASGKLTISWSPAGGHLLSSPTLGTGATWSSLSSTNPTVVPISGREQYFRVVNP